MIQKWQEYNNKRKQHICVAMEILTPRDDQASAPWKLYKRRWFFLALLTLLQVLAGTSYSMFGQISSFFVQYFRVTYTQVDWMTLSINVAPIVTTLPLTWLTFRRLLGFRLISIICALASAVGFACFAISMSNRLLFSVSVIGQSVVGVSIQLVMTTPSTFAALWFPETEVGTAIGINALGLYLGNIVGLMVPVYLFKHKTTNSTVEGRLMMLNEKRMSLLWIYLSCFALAALIVVLLLVFVTDAPTTPPTMAQEKKREAMGTNTSLFEFLSQTKAILTNRTFLSSSVIFGILFQAPTVEFTMMAEIVRQLALKHHLKLDSSIVGAWTMCYFSMGNSVGTIVAGKLVDKYKRYDRLTTIGTFSVFLSSIVVTLGLFTAYQLFYVGNLIQGFFIQVAMVTVYDMVTQQMYPIDETVVSIWLMGIVSPMGIFFGEIGRVLFNFFGGLGVLVFQCACMLIGFLLTFLLAPVYGRLDVAESEDHDGRSSADEERDCLLNGTKIK